MKKTYCILALFALLSFVACDESKPGEMPPAGPADSENPDKIAPAGTNDKFDGGAIADTADKVKGTAIQDSSTGLGGNKNPR